MKTPKTSRVLLMLALLVSLLSVAVMAQSAKKADPISALPFEKKGVPVTAQTEVKWKISAEYSSLVLTVSTPDGEVIRQEFKSGELPAFKLAGENGAALPDGQYLYELRLIPNLPSDVMEALAASREREEQAAARELESGGDSRDKSDSAATLRELRKSGKLPNELVHNGAFTIEKGVAFMGGSADSAKAGNQAPNRDPKISQQWQNQGQGRNQAVFMPAAMGTFDQVFADDLIVQGSACVGIDCVVNENFSFDTIRLKENNLRIGFDDTSSAAGFSARDWQLTANDSASGGASKFSIDDITGGLTPFTITAAAPTNSLFVSSTGRVGLRTGTPVLDLHIATGNTPAHRLEQNASGGFTAQTWDIGGNEANFFVRDVTGGSRLPFRIRPGAPTSSLDIATSGNVGIGTASPQGNLHLSRNAQIVSVWSDTSGSAGNQTGRLIYDGGTNVTGGGWVFQRATDAGAFAANLITVTQEGSIGIGVLNPTSPIQHSSGAVLTAGGAWTNASSRALKTNIKDLSSRDAFSALKQLNPVQFQYKADPAQNHVGFIAEDVPELVATSDRKGLSSMDIVAVLTKVVQEQQQTIAELKVKVEQLEKANVKKAKLKRKR